MNRETQLKRRFKHSAWLTHTHTQSVWGLLPLWYTNCFVYIGTKIGDKKTKLFLTLQRADKSHRISDSQCWWILSAENLDCRSPATSTERYVIKSNVSEEDHLHFYYKSVENDEKKRVCWGPWKLILSSPQLTSFIETQLIAGRHISTVTVPSLRSAF